LDLRRVEPLGIRSPIHTECDSVESFAELIGGIESFRTGIDRNRSEPDRCHVLSVTRRRMYRENERKADNCDPEGLSKR
jgi:hypothetical protein